MKNNSDDYVTQVLDSVLQVDARAWNALLAQQHAPSPFMRHEYLAALERSGSATPATGWTPRLSTLWRGGELQAACALYLKDHSYGEYVFDWAWANAYQQHGLAYYPKAVIAVPFTPVPGARLLARDAAARQALLKAVLAWCKKQKLSSLHLLFAADEDVAACEQAGLMLRHTVQFHWTNQSAGGGTSETSRRYADFEEFLASLAHDKRKKIRQERRKVARGRRHLPLVSGRGHRARRTGTCSTAATSAPTSSTATRPISRRDFFAPHGAGHAARTGCCSWPSAARKPDRHQPDRAERAARPGRTSRSQRAAKVAYGRYWGALERVDCLHFEACYYQPLQWCIAHGFDRFEGGAQGEHKMARALMPVKTHSAHWLAHPAFADAVERFLEREGQGIENYLEHLEERSPFRRA